MPTGWSGTRFRMIRINVPLKCRNANRHFRETVLQHAWEPMNYRLEYPGHAEALYHSLKEDPFYVVLERAIESPDSSRQAMLKYMDFSMTEAQNYGMLSIPDDHEFGASLWLKPLPKDSEHRKKKEKKEFLSRELGSKALDTYESIVDYMSARAEPFIKADHWYLSIVGVLPRYQGQGLGAELIRKVLAMTDRLQIPTYLETFTPGNMKFYDRLGYREAASFPEPITGAAYSLMIREPGTGQH